MLKAILFDFDGVIANTFDFCYQINKSLGSGLTEDQYRDLFNGNINDHFKEQAVDKREQKKGDGQFFKFYRPELMKLHPVPGMVEVIKKLAESSMLFIISSTDSGIIKDFLALEALLTCFTEVLGNDVDYSKVNKIKMIQEKYKFLSGDCVFITDTLGDIREAEKCGVKAIAVTWGYQPAETLAKGKPLKIINKPEDLVEINQIFLRHTCKMGIYPRRF